MKKAILGIVVAAVVVLAGAYFGSPYWAVRQMQAAARAGGGEPLNRYVDYPALRRGIMTDESSLRCFSSSSMIPAIRCAPIPNPVPRINVPQ